MIEDMSKLQEAIVRAASGIMPDLNIEVRFRRPIIEGYLGQVYRDGDKIAVDIDPDITPEKMFCVFLHEMGHVYHGHYSDAPDRAKVYQDLSPQFKADIEAGKQISQGLLPNFLPDKGREEAEADSFMRGVASYLASKAIYLYGSDDVLSKLLVLEEVKFQLVREE